MVDKPLTTNEVRSRLEDLGAVRPNRKAVEVVATQVGGDGSVIYWQMVTPDYRIEQAINACKNLSGEESNRKFEDHIVSLRLSP